MPGFTVTFFPQDIKVSVNKDATLLEAISKAGITINNLCGGDGICGRCKMIVLEGDISGEVSTKLTRDEIKNGYVLACMTYVKGDVVVNIPKETLAREKTEADEDAERFRWFKPSLYSTLYAPSPLVTKVYLELDKPSLMNNTADHQRVCEAIKNQLNVPSMQMGLKIIKILPLLLEENDYCITATVGLRRDIAEVMQVEGGDTSESAFMSVVDMGTTTIVVHLIDVNLLKTVDAEACFNSQSIYGREVTARMISAEKRGSEELQKLLISDINRLINRLAKRNSVPLKDIIAVVCAGNTAMGHFLLDLPTDHIRRSPYIPTSVEPPPLRAAEVGIQINPRGLLYSLPGISGWVGSDITAGILATGMSDSEDISLLVDMGTNGEIIIGNSEWLVACSASVGPALEGASVECGMRAEKGAIEKIYIENDEIRYKTIGNEKAKGMCGSGIIDIVSVLLMQKIINRSGKFIEDDSEKIKTVDGIKRYIIAEKNECHSDKPLFITESDIENIICAKAAIFAAMQILVKRLDLQFDDIKHFYIAGAFGNYINIEHAICIGLIPNIQRDRIEFAGNTSIWGAKIVAFYDEAFRKIVDIRKNTTYYDLMGAEDYVEEFKKAMFLPHTDIEQFSMG